MKFHKGNDMNEIEQFMNFLNNNLNDYDEQKFIAALANDADYRLNFKSYMSITNTLNKNINDIELPINSRDNFFSSIGLTSVGSTINENLKPKTSFFHGKLFTGIVSGLITSVTAYVLVSLMGYHLSNNNNNIAENSKINNAVGQISQEKSDGLNLTSNVPVIESRDTKNQIKKYYPKNNSIRTTKNIYYQEKSNIAVLSEDSLKETKKIDDLNFSQLASNCKYINPIRNSKKNLPEPIQNNSILPAIASLADEVGNNLGLTLEVKNSVSWNLPKETISPESYNKLNNAEFSLLYKLSDAFYIGADVKQETFFLEYQGTEDDGITYIYRRQPNYTTFSGLARYSPVKNNNLLPYAQINIGFNSGGYVIKPAIGLEYSAFENFSLNVGIEYNKFWFFHGSNWFNTDKINLNYGFSYKF